MPPSVILTDFIENLFGRVSGAFFTPEKARGKLPIDHPALMDIPNGNELLGITVTTDVYAALIMEPTGLVWYEITPRTFRMSVEGRKPRRWVSSNGTSENWLLARSVPDVGIIDIAGKATHVNHGGAVWQWWAFLPRDPLAKADNFTGPALTRNEAMEKSEASLLTHSSVTEFVSYTGAVRKAEGMAKVDAKACEAWKTAASEEIERLAKTGERFTAENVREVAGDPPGHPNAMGARMSAACKAGTIIQVGYEKAKRPEAHARVLAAYTGKVS